MNSSFGEVMKNKAARFWAVEHITGMLIAIAMITVARRKVKVLHLVQRAGLYLLALILTGYCSLAIPRGYWKAIDLSGFHQPDEFLHFIHRSHTHAAIFPGGVVHGANNDFLF